MASSSSDKTETNSIYLLIVFLIFVGLMAYTFLGEIGKSVESFDKTCESPFFSPVCKIGGWVGIAQECFTSPQTCRMEFLKQDISDAIENFKNASMQMGLSIQNYLLNHCDEARTTFIKSAESSFSFIFGPSSLANNMWGIFKTSFENLFAIACKNNINITSFESALYIFAATTSFIFFFLSIFFVVFMRWFPAIFSLIFSYLAAAMAYASANGNFIINKLVEGLGMFLPLFMIGLYIIFTMMFIQTLWFIIYICYIKFGQGAKLSLPRFADFSGVSHSIPAGLIVVVIAIVGVLLFFGATVTQNIVSAVWGVVLLSAGLYIAYLLLRKGDGNFYLPTFPSVLMNNIIPAVLALISLRSESLQAYFAQAGFLNSETINSAFAQASGETSSMFLSPTQIVIFDPATWGSGFFINLVYVLLFVLVMAVVNKYIFLRIIKGEAVNLWSGALHQGINKIKELNAKITTYEQQIAEKERQLQRLDLEYNQISMKLTNLNIILNKDEADKMRQRMNDIISEKQKMLIEMNELKRVLGQLHLLVNNERTNINNTTTDRIEKLQPGKN